MTAATLNLEEVPASDAADAQAVGLCHLLQASRTDLAAREIVPGQEL